ncbi:MULTISPECIES: antibiotic biosynthesis monooxygenase [Streptomyces]|uniref:antibiotic biosynthesis monooxygenase n=1 Tax=Streptomyces TaxID=1883 RepID=UPI00287F843D|nr:antibiotic biosynthesis monooxygenase [Streptomyces sp. CGMCC 4.1456]WNF64218.1 antibiotic biosynthesis monooxygenase [Streptomyces sp. CGMCC 4.1456]
MERGVTWVGNQMPAVFPLGVLAAPGTWVIGTRYADGPDRQQGLVDDELASLKPPPTGLALSTDGETVLTLARWDDAAGVPPAGPPRYRLYSSLAEERETRVPGCLITAAFDVDGPERQRSFTDAVIAAQPGEGGHPGAISAHFLHSVDGSRVLLYTEWTSAEAHQEAAEAGDHDEGHELFSGTPGVRLTRGGRFRLYRKLR